MIGRGIQIDVTFIQNPQTTVSKAKSLDDNSLVMKPMLVFGVPHIHWRKFQILAVF